MRLERVPPTTMPSYADLFDFPIPHCEKCEEQMVKMPNGKWGCNEHTLVTVGLTPNFVTGEIEPIQWPLGWAYPNRRERRKHL